MRQPFGTTLFCDDIRQEVGGKYSLIGVYADQLVLQEPPPSIDIPVVLTKLALSIIIVIPNEYPDYKEGILKVISEHGEEEREEILFQSPLPDRKSRKPLSGDIAKIVANMVLSPFIIKGRTNVKVRAYLDDYEIRLGMLQVTIANKDLSPDSVSLSADALP